MRLIDADGFEIEELYKRDEVYYRDTFESGVRRVLKEIADAPSVDAVLVVRCGLCKWKGKRHQKCSCCIRNRRMKDCYEVEDDGRT